MFNKQGLNDFSQYPEPGSNRHGLLHWCLRPARLPIPPSGLFAGAKIQHIFEIGKYLLKKIQKICSYQLLFVI